MAIRKLNLVMTYPVKWGEYEVMNNFVQNFYDALGMDSFCERFNVSFANGTIVMKSDVGFSKDWLFYIGASTKRGGDKQYAGKFGEGFKIAALVAIRDMGMGVCMESRDWRMNVIEAEDEIDGKAIKVLAYDISDRPYKEGAVLTLTGATQIHYNKLFYQINNFYYEGNGYFGRCIAKGDEFAVYTAVKSPNEKRVYGGLFLNLEHRASFSVPIFFCLHKYLIPGDDRDRHSLPSATVIDAVRKVVSFLSPEEALEVLEMLSSKWFDYVSRRGIYNYNWYRVISGLIEIIASDKPTLSVFTEKYADSLVAESNWSMLSNHDKAMAYEWFKHSEYSGRRRVCSLFRRMGITDLYTLCYENGGFEEESLPNNVQKKRIEILQFIAREYFADIICYDTLPECRIILNAKSPLAGKAECQREDKKVLNSMGLRVVFRIRTVYIKRQYLEEKTFSSALPIYMHELLHQYGGDSSIQFRKVLIRMNEIIIERRKEIFEVESKWKAC